MVELEPDVDWLDQRDVPVYPLVRASKEIVKAYNPQIKQKYKPEKYAKVKNPPNIVFCIAESFGPSPMYYDEDFMAKSGRVLEGPLFSEKYVPNIRKFAQQGVSFSGLSS